MSAQLEKIDKSRLPRHIAIIMDGNGRWAKEQGHDRLYGHFHGVESVRNIVEGCAELGIEYLTLYAFSTENWDRPEYEVVGLMELLVNTIAILKDRQSVSSNTDFYGYGGAYRPYAWGGGMGTVSASTTYNVENYKDGSLIIDVVEAATKKLIWQGTGNSEIDKPLKDPDKQIPAAITKIMASFPGELSK